ncbi:MAG TPA: FAD-dependent oxidoreductase [Candidatus Dormibacteraeota bacterium]|nr:FAD-dependent oxidoreductase [Candidatus Dormibacteraeota bacterium]
MAAGLRDGGWDGDIALIGAEPERPYERPHLSKGYLAGSVAREKLWLRPAGQYRELRVDLILGTEVVDLGLDRREVVFEGGRTMRWDRLCIAVGSDARRLAGFEDAMYLRDLPQADAVRGEVARRERLEIVGAGFVGCEVAAVAAAQGCEVRVYEALEQPLLRVLGRDLGAYIAEVHRAHGVDLRVGSEPPPRADLVAVGSVPRMEIVADELGRTSHEDVYAAGDVARFYHPLFETHVRVEHFQTSQRQGFATGRAMAGAGQPYGEVPWFWSDQYDLNLQYVGAGLPWDEIVTRGTFGRPPFTVFYLRGGEVVGAAGINDHHTIARTRRVMEARASVSRLQLEDPSFDLRRALV